MDDLFSDDDDNGNNLLSWDDNIILPASTKELPPKSRKRANGFFG
jgi:hypothetical protein